MKEIIGSWSGQRTEEKREALALVAQLQLCWTSLWPVGTTISCLFRETSGVFR
ncbi:hypothetical protein [Escherichia albertii]|uniref:hypothetical protein n=1 Tax=Escherichia albertii TaxID=208962 RepID=UPI00211A0E48|nr:hypothetical protein [Escherichia albertii]UUK85240.1 hypothetical protein NIZ22_22875 [Escherichia albertii]